MASAAIDNYITKSYARWLDYARYHALLASIIDQAGDILNEVLASLLEKPSSQLTTLLNNRSGQYTELDFYVLKMIKLNARSDKAPYRFKTKTIPQDCNISPWDLDIVDQVGDSQDMELIKLQKYQKAREIVDQLNVPAREKEIFSWKFFGDNHLIDWPG